MSDLRLEVAGRSLGRRARRPHRGDVPRIGAATATDQRQVRQSGPYWAGDRMNTDVVAGLEAGLETVLVVSGVSRIDDVDRYPYRTTRIVSSVADLADEFDNADALGDPH